ncbi:holo-[acyl-carrier-protein] synthase [Thermanaeromonas toyohensis ToBE]|uniref:Holo-[acyl-carrier-protein] synthase n=1 Tax=Thermanaeromonas toyohensis ToBE TaxID=698762 RepID=A0A1W1VCB3_9FIRM|nr:holo-ACP synthase [Thermanaeromonas toyohensis]SMB91002.1 holo-[acyl-carrier-protein] synthase [Thermanaeromonas toyohensis ToBE]
MIGGIGVDIMEIDRIKRALERHPRLLKRVFTPQEEAYCLAKPRPEVSLAARWAAKEAVFKVLGLRRGELRWREIEVLSNNWGAPRVRLHGRLAELARSLGIKEITLSLSHSREYAVAVAIGVGTSVDARTPT